MFQQNKSTIHDMNIWNNYTTINKHASSQQKQYKKKGLIRNNLLHGALFFLRGYIRVQNLCNYLWNLKILAWEYQNGDYKYKKFRGMRKFLSESVKECTKFWDLVSIYRGWNA